MRAEESDPLGPIVREALGQSRTDCPDVELLAAYADRTLHRSAELDLQRHLAACARCRETVLLMTRAADAETAGAEAMGSGTRLQPRFPYLKWLGGAVAAGLAVALWALVAPREDLTRFNKAEDKRSPVAAEAQPESAPPPPAPKVEPQPERRGAVAKDTAGARERDDRATVAEKSAEKSSRQESAAAPAAPPAATVEEGKSDAFLDRAERQRGNAQTLSALSAQASLDAEAPGGSVRWRIGPDGSIQRSVDRGTTWMDETGVKAVGARAMSAPAPDVCWIVGDAGLVLRYDASRGWVRLSAPTDASLVAVIAIDALRATVTLPDGRRLSTEDGGASWK